MKSERHVFLYSYIFSLTRLDHLISFFFIRLKLKVESRTHDYIWSIDLMTVLFSVPLPF